MVKRTMSCAHRPLPSMPPSIATVATNTMAPPTQMDSFNHPTCSWFPSLPWRSRTETEKKRKYQLFFLFVITVSFLCDSTTYGLGSMAGRVVSYQSAQWNDPIWPQHRTILDPDVTNRLKIFPQILHSPLLDLCFTPATNLFILFCFVCCWCCTTVSSSSK